MVKHSVGLVDLKETKIPVTNPYTSRSLKNPMTVHLSNYNLHQPLLVENNGCLAVKPKNVKLSYAEMVKVTTAVEMQDRIIGNGGDPTTDLIQVDIKKK